MIIRSEKLWLKTHDKQLDKIFDECYIKIVQQTSSCRTN